MLELKGVFPKVNKVFTPLAVPVSISLKTNSLFTFKVIAPFDALVTFIPVLDLIYDVPSTSVVNDPLSPNVDRKDPVTSIAISERLLPILILSFKVEPVNVENTRSFDELPENVNLAPSTPPEPLNLKSLF